MPFDPTIHPSKGAALGGITGAGASLLTGGHSRGQQPQQSYSAHAQRDISNWQSRLTATQLMRD